MSPSKLDYAGEMYSLKFSEENLTDYIESMLYRIIKRKNLDISKRQKRLFVRYLLQMSRKLDYETDLMNEAYRVAMQGEYSQKDCDDWDELVKKAENTDKYDSLYSGSGDSLMVITRRDSYDFAGAVEGMEEAEGPEEMEGAEEVEGAEEMEGAEGPVSPQDNQILDNKLFLAKIEKMNEFNDENTDFFDECFGKVGAKVLRELSTFNAIDLKLASLLSSLIFTETPARDVPAAEKIIREQLKKRQLNYSKKIAALRQMMGMRLGVQMSRTEFLTLATPNHLKNALLFSGYGIDMDLYEHSDGEKKRPVISSIAKGDFSMEDFEALLEDFEISMKSANELLDRLIKGTEKRPE